MGTYNSIIFIGELVAVLAFFGIFSFNVSAQQTGKSDAEAEAEVKSDFEDLKKAA